MEWSNNLCSKLDTRLFMLGYVQFKIYFDIMKNFELDNQMTEVSSFNLIVVFSQISSSDEYYR